MSNIPITDKMQPLRRRTLGVAPPITSNPWHATPHPSTRALAQVQLATSSASGEQRRGKAISDANTRNNTEPGNLRSPDQRNDGDERAIFQRLVFSLSGGVRRKKQKVSEKRNGKKEKGEQAESPYYS